MVPQPLSVLSRGIRASAPRPVRSSHFSGHNARRRIVRGPIATGRDDDRVFPGSHAIRLARCGDLLRAGADRCAASAPYSPGHQCHPRPSCRRGCRRCWACPAPRQTQQTGRQRLTSNAETSFIRRGLPLHPARESVTVRGPSGNPLFDRVCDGLLAGLAHLLLLRVQAREDPALARLDVCAQRLDVCLAFRRDIKDSGRELLEQ